jgi:hypothetical protein
MDNQPNDLLQQCRQHFPGLPWESSGASSCTAKVPSLIFGQALIVWSDGNGDFEVSIQTNIEGSRLSKRLWVGADAIAQAAERWREFSAEVGAVVEQGPGWMAEPVLVKTREFTYDAEAMAVVEHRPTGKRLRAIGEATKDV